MEIQTYPQIDFVNQDNYPKYFTIRTYAYSYEIPDKNIYVVKPKSKIRIAVNPKKAIPQYVWHSPPKYGKATFLIDPDVKEIKI